MNLERSIKEFGLGSAFPDLDEVTKIVQGDAPGTPITNLSMELQCFFQ